MKNIFFIAITFLFLASFLALPASAEGPILLLTNQNDVQVTQFETSDEIYIQGLCLPANQDVAKIYITQDKTWQAGDRFSDVSGGIETFVASSDGTVPRTKIWRSPLREGLYDVAIDTNNDLILQDYEMACVIGTEGAGFRVGNPVVQQSPVSAPLVSTPPPTPPLPTKPSTTFSFDERVEVSSVSNVRKSAGGKLVGTQIEGALGVVVGGPVQASLGEKKFWFWNVDFENVPDGWVSESALKTAPAPVPEPALETAAIATTTATSTPEVQTNTNATTSLNMLNVEAGIAGRMLAQALDGLKPLANSIIVGLALFLGLILGSVIISKALRGKI